MKSTDVDESLSTTSTDVLFQRIPTNLPRLNQQNEKSKSRKKDHPEDYLGTKKICATEGTTETHTN